MKLIDHNNVIKLIDFYEDKLYPERDGSKKKCIITVLEYASSGELFDYITFIGQVKDKEKITRTYFRQLISGVEAIHQLGIAHRDLKPENLLLDHNFVLKIADFGFASLFKSEEDGETITLKTRCGTPLYMAPEILYEESYSEKCDIFSVGVILFVLYCGFPPFEKPVYKDWWFEKIVKGQYGTFWKAHEQHITFSKHLKSLILQCLQPDPKDRLNASQIKYHDWYREKIIKKQETLKKRLEKHHKESMDVRLTKIRQSQQQLNPNDQSIILDYRTQKANVQQMTEFAKRCQQIDPNDEYELNIQSIDLDNYQNTSPYQFVTQMGPREVAARLEKIINRLLGKIEFAAKQTCTYITLAVTNDNNNEIPNQKK